MFRLSLDDDISISLFKKIDFSAFVKVAGWHIVWRCAANIDLNSDFMELMGFLSVLVLAPGLIL